MKFVISAGGLARRLEAPFNISGTMEDLRRLKTAIEEVFDTRFTDRTWLSIDVIEPPFVGDERFSDAAPWPAGPEGIPVDADFAEVLPESHREDRWLAERHRARLVPGGDEHASGEAKRERTAAEERVRAGFGASRIDAGASAEDDSVSPVLRAIRAVAQAQRASVAAGQAGKREVHVDVDGVRVTEAGAKPDAKDRREGERRRASPPADSDHSCARPGDPALERFRDWWHFQTLKGDPQRRAHLTEDAYMSGHVQGRVDEGARLLNRARGMPDSAVLWMLHEHAGNFSPALEEKLLAFGRACLNAGAGVTP